jgi:hypothetical protein
MTADANYGAGWALIAPDCADPVRQGLEMLSRHRELCASLRAGEETQYVRRGHSLFADAPARTAHPATGGADGGQLDLEEVFVLLGERFDQGERVLIELVVIRSDRLVFGT